jgi:hypothetical protein
MKRMNRTILSLVASVAMVGALFLLGCPGDDEEECCFRPATADDLNNKSFTFADGSVFHPGLAGNATTLTFTNNATRFALQESGTTRRATGDVTFGSCTLTVGPNTNPNPNPPGGSNFPAGTGPQPEDVLEFPTCNFNPDNNTLLLVNLNGVTGVSSNGIPTGTGGGGS